VLVLRQFQADGQAHVEIDILICGICSWLQFADQRCLWLSMLETGWQRSIKYAEAMLCWLWPLFVCV